MRRRIVSIATGLVGLLVFVVACAWVTADGQEVSPRVLAIMLCAVVCLTVVSVGLWLAPDERVLAAAQWLAMEADGRPPARSVR